MPKPTFNESVSAGPFSIQFCNLNTEMELKGHCHFAKVFLEFETLGSVGFPSFEHTHREIQTKLMELTERPFRSHTNEAVLRSLFQAMRDFPYRETAKYAAEFALAGMELHVRGVPDKIGHADSFTVYRIHC